MTNKELIDQLTLLKSLIEWDLPMDYQVVIDEAIEIIGYPLLSKEEKERARRKRRKAYLQQYYLEHKEAYREQAKRFKEKHK